MDQIIREESSPSTVPPSLLQELSSKTISRVPSKGTFRIGDDEINASLNGGDGDSETVNVKQKDKLMRCITIEDLE